MSFFGLSCSSPKEEDEDVISVTINNPSDFAISSLTVTWGTYDMDSKEAKLDGSEDINSPEFPCKYEIKNYSKSNYFFISVSDDSDTYFGTDMLDTTDGGEIDSSITLELDD